MAVKTSNPPPPAFRGSFFFEGRSPRATSREKSETAISRGNNRVSGRPPTGLPVNSRDGGRSDAEAFEYARQVASVRPSPRLAPYFSLSRKHGSSRTNSSYRSNGKSRTFEKRPPAAAKIHATSGGAVLTATAFDSRRTRFYILRHFYTYVQRGTKNKIELRVA